jgi:hypothetical protein
VRMREWGHRMRPTHRFDLVRSQHVRIIAYRTCVRKPESRAGAPESRALSLVR